MKKQPAFQVFIALFAALMLLSGCAATQTSIRYSELEVQTRMSDSIFLNPVSPAMRTVYIQVRNTSDQNFFIEKEVAAALASKGYQVVNNPDLAHFFLQANVLAVGRADRSASEEVRLAGFGSPVAGAVIGGLLGGTNARTEGAVIGAIVAGAAEMISGAATKVVNYTVVTDVQITEKTNQAVSQRSNTNLSQGSSTRVTEESAATTNQKRYRTRVVSTARKVNLEFKEAYPALRNGLVQALAGLF